MYKNGRKKLLNTKGLTKETSEIIRKRSGENHCKWKGGKRAAIRRYYYKHKERNREKKRLWNKVRKHNLRKAGILTVALMQRVYEDNIKKCGTLTCYLCNKVIEFGKDTLEHKTPVSRGGKNIYENLEIAHRKCNEKKHIKTVEEYENR